MWEILCVRLARNSLASQFMGTRDSGLGSLVTGMPADTNTRATSSLRAWCLAVLPEARFANEAVYAVCINQFSTLTLMWHAYRQVQTATQFRRCASGCKRLSVGQKPITLCEEEATKRKPTEEVSSFVLPTMLD